MNVVGKDKRRIPGSVKYEIEIMFRMTGGYPFKGLIFKPSDSLKFVLNQQLCVYGNSHKFSNSITASLLRINLLDIILFERGMKSYLFMIFMYVCHRKMRAQRYFIGLELKN